MKTYRWMFPLLWCGAVVRVEAQTPQPPSPKPATTQLAPVAPAPSPKLPPMTLTAQFGGPLRDTAIQRFVDAETGVVCYLYTPYKVPNSRDEKEQIVYGANNIGNISCVAPWKRDAPRK